MRALPPARRARILWLAAGACVPVVLAAALVPWRDDVAGVDVALVLVVAVVVIAVMGGRAAGAVAAVTTALSFDFFHTRPYLHFRIDSRDDVTTTVLLLLVGLIVGTVATAGRRAQHKVDLRTGEIRRIYHLAGLGARGRGPDDVIEAARTELTELLGLRACTFESPPFRTDYERLERSGTVAWREYRMLRDGFELPTSGLELPVLGRGQLFGRFVLLPTPGVGVSLEQRVVAVALADQVGAVLAAPAAPEAHDRRLG